MTQLIADRGGRCERCSKTYHPNIYDWHHIDPTTKLFTIDRAGMNRNYTKLKNEVEKCALLCANCHREVHTFLDKKFLVVPGDFVDYELELPPASGRRVGFST